MHKINIYKTNQQSGWCVFCYWFYLWCYMHAWIQIGEGNPDPPPPPIWKITSDIRFPQKYWYGPPSKEKEKNAMTPLTKISAFAHDINFRNGFLYTHS